MSAQGGIILTEFCLANALDAEALRNYLSVSRLRGNVAPEEWCLHLANKHLMILEAQ